MLDRKSIEEWVQRLDQELTLMQKYCDCKRDGEDWHGVMDASADIRELLIAKRTLRIVLGEGDATV